MAVPLLQVSKKSAIVYSVFSHTIDVADDSFPDNHFDLSQLDSKAIDNELVFSDVVGSKLLVNEFLINELQVFHGNNHSQYENAVFRDELLQLENKEQWGKINLINDTDSGLSLIIEQLKNNVQIREGVLDALDSLETIRLSLEMDSTITYASSEQEVLTLLHRDSEQKEINRDEIGLGNSFNSKETGDPLLIRNFVSNSVRYLIYIVIIGVLIRLIVFLFTWSQNVNLYLRKKHVSRKKSRKKRRSKKDRVKSNMLKDEHLESNKPRHRKVKHYKRKKRKLRSDRLKSNMLKDNLKYSFYV